jgi:hypothetical protein
MRWSQQPTTRVFSAMVRTGTPPGGVFGLSALTTRRHELRAGRAVWRRRRRDEPPSDIARCPPIAVESGSQRRWGGAA